MTSLLALYAFRQWRTVDDTLREIHAQTPAVLKSAEAAASSAATAKTAQDSSDASTKATLAEMIKQSTFAGKLSEQTSTLAKTATQQLDVSERPLLAISDLKLPIVLVADASGNIAYNYDLSVENKGRSSSLNTVVLQDFLLPMSSAYNPMQDLRYTCHKLDTLGPFGGLVIAPGDKPTLKQQSYTGRSELPKLLKTAFVEPTTQNRIINARLSVCLIYQSPLSPQVHHTALLYNVTLTFTPPQVDVIINGPWGLKDAVIVSPDHIVVQLQAFINGISD